MPVLVAYASRHDATRGIAERIAARLTAAGLQVDTTPVAEVRDLRSYDAVVLGSALYMFVWLGEARAFVRKNRRLLSEKPLWLFSSGPHGSEPLDEKGRDKLLVSGPKELDKLRRELQPRDHRVFFGAWSHSYKPTGFAEKFTARMPSAWNAIPEGDWRDWPAINAWADEIAAQLTQTSSPR